jgi:hypothetical protein
LRFQLTPEWPTIKKIKTTNVARIQGKCKPIYCW